MKVLVCGSRLFEDYNLLRTVLDGFDISEIIHGAARGADTLGGRYAEAHSIPVTSYPAIWDLHGKRAGPIRNGRMLKEGKPDMVVAFLGPNSRGTKNMIELATKAGIEVKVINI